MSISINSTCCRCSGESTYLALLFFSFLVDSVSLPIFSLPSVYITVGIQYNDLTTCSCHWKAERVALILSATLFHEVKVGWCMGMTQRDVVGREVGGGFMFGNACKN